MAKKTNSFINYINVKMIHEVKSGDGRTFYNVTIPYAQSATGYANVAVNAGQVLPAKNKDGAENPDFRTILLGAEEKSRKVSVCTKKKTDTERAEYENITMTNAEIRDMFEQAREQYKASKKNTEKETETETE